ncbi:MAG: histidine kinase [Crocinitomicaceae bacterium]
MRFLLVILFLVPLAFAGFTQKFSFVSYSTAEGLPQSQVKAIAQDDEGYLWVGTIGGLTKFNGEAFVPYTSREGLLNNRITSLDFIDGTLWVGHDGGVSSIADREIKKYAFTGDDKSRPVNQIIQFNGEILACSNGGGLFILKGGKLERIELSMLSSNRIRGAHMSNGVLYLATRDGILATKDLKSFSIQPEFGEHSFSKIIGDENELIASTYDSLLIRKNLASGEISVRNPENIESIYGCFLDAHKNVWLYARTGLVKIGADGSNYAFNQDSGLPLNFITCIFEDQNKNIWAGSQGKGIFRFPGFRFVYYDQSNGYLSDLLTCGFQLDNGDKYFGTFDKGILFKPKDGPVRKVETNTSNVIVWSAIKNVDGKHWFGTQNSLVSIDKMGNIEEITQTDNPNLPGQRVVCFTKIDDQSMYLGGNEGVSLYRNGTFTKLGKGDTELLGTVRDMVVVNGDLYCVSNLGMYVYRNNEFEQIQGGMGRVNYNIAADASGTIWVGSESGLYFYKNNEMSRLSLFGDDPRANNINFMKFRDGKLFIGTNNGLVTIVKSKGELVIRRYGIGDGIPDLETNLNSGFFDNEGNFWFGTSSGMVCYHQNVQGTGVTPPIVHLKSIKLNFTDFDYGTYSENLLPNGMPEKLVLPYTKNNLIFELDGVALVNHDELKYEYRLLGLSNTNDWSPSVSTITFTNLPAGDYVLQMRAVDLEGRQSEVVELPFLINEAYYKTWWFISLCALLLGGIILIVFRFRLRRIQQINENEMLSYKARMLSLEQKSLNASMNRHFIFNSLNSIQYFINTRDRLSANKYLTNFAKLIRKNLDSASLEDNLISLEDEVSRIKLYLSLESMRFKDRFDYEITTNDIDLEMYQIPAMLLQPFIENSIIHGILPNEEVKGLIEVIMEMKGDMLEILIRDNGIGVNQSMSRKAIVAGDHRSQGMEITSKRIELMQKFSNNEIKLLGPEELIGDDSSVNGTYVLLKLRPQNLED